MDLARGLDTLLVAAVVAALAPVVVALLPGPRIPQVVVLLAGGVVAGPEVLGWAERAEIDLLANVGLGFLFLLDIPRLVGVKRRLAGCGATRPWVRRSWCGGGGSRAGCRPAGWPGPAGPGGGSRRGRAAGRSRPGRRVSGSGR